MRTRALTALRASEHGRVIVVTKRTPTEANTQYAQGGVAAVLGPDDTAQSHVEDTLRVGDGLCNPGIVYDQKTREVKTAVARGYPV